MRIGIVTKLGRAYDDGGRLAQGPNGGTLRRRREAKSVEAEGVDWVCAVAEAGAEFRVADDLEAIGFRVFAPHGVRICLQARVGGGRRARMERDYPVFDRYLFVGQPQGLLVAKRSHPRLAGVLLDHGEPARVPARFVAATCEVWLAGFWDSRVKPADPRLKRGARARILDGAFRGWEAVIEDLPSEARAVVSVAMFGTSVPAHIDTGSLELV